LSSRLHWNNVVPTIVIFYRDRRQDGRKSGDWEHVRMAQRKSAGRKKTARKGTRRWSARVTRTSDALDLSGGVFTWKDPRRIAGSLKRSAMRSKRRKADPYRSALSMLTFYMNRAGKNLPAERKRTLGRAKEELRKQFGRG
jgi:uncharacterized protein DUF3175